MESPQIQKTIVYLDNLSDWTGRTVAWLTLLMMLVTCTIVVARYGFNIGSIALQESVIYLHGLVLMTSIAYTLRHQGHVRVDIFYARFTPGTQALIDLLGTLIFLFPFSIFLFYCSLDYVSLSWSLGESSGQPGGLPGVYLLKALIPLFSILLFLQGIAELLRNLTILTRH